MNKNIFLLFIVCICFISCSENDISDNAARVRIKITGTPFIMTNEYKYEIKEVNLDIQSIEIATTDSSATTPGEWFALDFINKEYDLLSLTNGKTIQVVDQYYPANKTIKNIKITLGDKSKIIALSAAGNKDLIVPQEFREVIITNVNENLYASVISSIVIDMRTFISESNGNYFLTPKIRSFAETFGGSIRGNVAPLEAAALISVLNEPDTLYTFPDAEGKFTFIGLKEGEWQIGVFANPASGFNDTIFTDSVFTGKVTELKPNPIRLKANNNTP